MAGYSPWVTPTYSSFQHFLEADCHFSVVIIELKALWAPGRVTLTRVLRGQEESENTDAGSFGMASCVTRPGLAANHICSYCLLSFVLQ